MLQVATTTQTRIALISRNPIHIARSSSSSVRKESFLTLDDEDLAICRAQARLAEASRGGGKVPSGSSCTVRDFDCKEPFGDRKVSNSVLLRGTICKQ